jgi:hypothetical protein
MFLNLEFPTQLFPFHASHKDMPKKTQEARAGRVLPLQTNKASSTSLKTGSNNRNYTDLATVITHRRQCVRSQIYPGAQSPKNRWEDVHLIGLSVPFREICAIQGQLGLPYVPSFCTYMSRLYGAHCFGIMRIPESALLWHNAPSMERTALAKGAYHGAHCFGIRRIP